MSNLGFVGLGIMGKPMCRNLARAGHRVVAYDHKLRASDSVPGFEPLQEAGILLTRSARSAAGQADVLITMLPDGPEVEEVILGPDGVLEGSRPGSTVIDMSSISPLVAQRIGQACGRRDVRFLDAPVSGGEPKAVDGTLAIMAGGDRAVFEEVEPILRAMGSSVTLTGPVGAGNVTKLANQIIVAANIAAMGEALVLATRAGLDPGVVFEAVKGGLAGSAVLNAKAPMVLCRNFKPGFRIRLHEKDLRNALSTAESYRVPLPLTSAVQQMLLALMNQGKGDLDHSAIVNLLEQMADVEVRPHAAAVAELRGA